MHTGLKSLNYPGKLIVFGLLALASLVSTLWILHIKLPSGKPPYTFIWWNMLLAWIPAVLTVLLDLLYSVRRGSFRKLLLMGTGLVWLGFYPNAPYMITDMLHVFARYSYQPDERFWAAADFWNHTFAMLLVGLTGLFMGCVLLDSVKQLVRRSFGRTAGVLFALAVLLLSSFAIYIGRFIRGNTWDIVTSPLKLYNQLTEIWSTPAGKGHMLYFCAMIFTVLTVTYVLTWAISITRKPVGERSLYGR
ncbi:DUF1361 domain-containing protein [Paenibacillus sp. P96]|uniref:DUF1361 domain-containing protein n=1 Tax=Paenibacillus zeirhizosphaerae TaxID=2987519 RepID=A0ABT9FSA5_9BACL|nr:DUF1361 domain-containing protein [Paenibacillus sp. P96]MDP4097619.1 DUF1361 domain-containing protein [Paenibacillus sp. P96]